MKREGGRIYNKKKSEQLGMPFGTACHRLRVRVMLHLLKRHGENICFKCGKKINQPEDLSIEHKRPWLGYSNRRFWSMKNIAFSHRKCNRPHVHGAVQLRKIGPKNTAWCTGCKEFLPISSFCKDKEHWNGYSKHCKKCVNERKKERRAKLKQELSNV